MDFVWVEKHVHIDHQQNEYAYNYLQNGTGAQQPENGNRKITWLYTGLETSF